MGRLITPEAVGLAGISRRQVLASGALAAAPLLAGDHIGAPARRPHRRLRLKTTPDLETVLAMVIAADSTICHHGAAPTAISTGIATGAVNGMNASRW